MDEFSVENLSSYLDKKNFYIIRIYSIGGSCSFIRVICGDTGDDLVISIPFKYPMKSSDAVELVQFTDTEIDDRFVGSRDIKESYNQITINGLEDDKLYLDPAEADRLIEQYQAIDIDGESSDILKENIVSYKQQLDRLKYCTNNIKYKLCIVTSSSFCTINRNNNTECYAVKKGKPVTNEDKELCIIIDLENFYDKVDNIHTDINRVYKNLYDIMGRAHKKQTAIISSRLRQYQALSDNLSKRYKLKEKYEESIKSINNTLAKIKRQEKDLKKQISNTTNNTDNSLIASTTRSFTAKKLEEDYNKLLQFKDESVNLLSDIKTEYNNFVLDFDYALFSSIRLFNHMTTNFVKIGVIGDCKSTK